MKRTLLVSSGPADLRLVLLEDAEPVEMLVESRRQPSRVGAIYLGQVRRVVRGMDAAFVDIGLERSAYLPLADVHPDGSGLKRGQPVVVQIKRDGLGSKGARLTMKLSLPARHLVLLPGAPARLSISRKIDDDDERERLRSLPEQRPLTCGAIVRTGARGVALSTLAAELDELEQRHARLQADARAASAPAEVAPAPGALHRRVTEELGSTLDEVIVDDADLHQHLVSSVPAQLGERIVLDEDRASGLFQRRGIADRLRLSLGRIVPLPSGGALTFDKTEAMWVVDVDTGRYVGRKGFEATALEINLEAATAIGRVLRLRGIGGLITIDFIDMREAEHRAQVLARLRAGLDRTRTPTTVTDFNALGLVSISRKRDRQELDAHLLESCPACDGAGTVPSRGDLAERILRELAMRSRGGSALVVQTVPAVIELLRAEHAGELDQLARLLERKIQLHADPGFERGRFRIRP